MNKCQEQTNNRKATNAENRPTNQINFCCHDILSGASWLSQSFKNNSFRRFKFKDEIGMSPGLAIYLFYWMHPIISSNELTVIICSLICLETAITCSVLPTQAHGSKACTGKGYEYGNTCTFTCDVGYERKGSFTRTCQADRQWSGTQTTCEGMVKKQQKYWNKWMLPITTETRQEWI